MAEYIVEMTNISKVYDNGTVANKGVNLKLKKGEIHALLGENGAGKSTLMKILFGMQKPSTGTIKIKGKEVWFSSPKNAIDMGVGMVHQHFMLVPDMSIAENLMLGEEITRGIKLDKEKMIETTNEFAKKYGFNLSATSLISEISIGVKQKVEILKALYRGAEVLILDEPTAVLTPQETEELFEQLKKIVKTGKTIIFISHKLEEVKAICNTMSILKHGNYVGSYNVGDLSVDEISEKMVGRDVELKFHLPKMKVGDSRLSVRNCTIKDDSGVTRVNNISFDVRSGQIIAVAGVEGNGQKELVDAITGFNGSYVGSIKVQGTEVKDTTIQNMRASGFRYIPEDRIEQGLAIDMSIKHNLVLDNIANGEFRKMKVFLSQKAMTEYAKVKIIEYEVKCESEEAPMSSLSGGNMQKVVCARELSSNPPIVIINQPTRGIDVGSAELIRRKIIELRNRGAAILLITADLNEVLEVSDKIMVMCHGEIVGFFEDSKAVCERELGTYMLGIKKMKQLKGVVYEKAS